MPVFDPKAPKVYEMLVADRTLSKRLLRGFYAGTEGWRWTGRRFAVALDVPPPADVNALLELDFNAPVELMNDVGSVTVSARVNGGDVGKAKYAKEGRYLLRFNVPPTLLKTSPALVEFELNRSSKEPGSGRERGLIVVTVALKHAESVPLDREAAAQIAQQGYLQLLQQRRTKLSVEKQNELMKLFHDLDVWRQTWFQNVQIEKNPLDLWMMQQIIYEVQPEFIVETGTWKGGSALYWAHTLNGMGLENSRVLTVDIQNIAHTAAAHPLWKKYVTFFKGSSTDPKIVAEIAQRTGGHKTLVTLDSDHSLGHVLNELKAYAPMVTSRSYLVVEDTHIDGVPTQPGFGPGPLSAVLQFLKEGGNKDFEQDFSREAMVMTFNPGGWLRRK
jgi:cephalosporin hydroxylase